MVSDEHSGRNRRQVDFFQKERRDVDRDADGAEVYKSLDRW
jgi:hypothetical protein